MAEEDGSSSNSDAASTHSDSSSKFLFYDAVDSFWGDDRADKGDPLAVDRIVPFSFIVPDLFSGCSTVGRTMCQFSRSITSKDISSAVRGSTGMYEISVYIERIARLALSPCAVISSGI